MPDDSRDAPEMPSEEAFCSTVERSASSLGTSTPEWMWVVFAPPTVELPTTVGLWTQPSGSMPSLPSTPEPELD